MSTEPAIQLPYRPGPITAKGELVARSRGVLTPTRHESPWLVAEIHGPDFEWAPIVRVPVEPSTPVAS
jgi:hypothetical protein